MPSDLLARLSSWKTRFGTPDSTPLERLLTATSATRFRDPHDLIALHETLLFLRAYPASPGVARLADSILFSFADRIEELRESGIDLSPFEEAEVSGIAGTSLSAVFSYEVATRLAARHRRRIEIAWDRYDEPDKLGSLMTRFVPLLCEDWPVEAHAPYREWFAAARGGTQSDLVWLLEELGRLPLAAFERAERFDALQLPLTWEMGTARTSRSRLRLSNRTLYCHREPLLQRRDVSLARELEGPKLPVRRLGRAKARAILDLILDTSAMRYRELYGFSHPDETGVFHADAGRGVDVYFFGVPPEWRLPLRAYHAGMFFKNGVPAGYVELLSLFERAEVGFNLYYTFREGESAWLYARLLRLFRQVLGVNCFSVDPYQIGHENPEAIASGAFWFYRKLGFRPVDPEIARLVDREERRMNRTPGYRSSARTLERLGAGYVLYEEPSAQSGAWDNFRIRNLALAAASMQSANGLESVISLIPDLSQWSNEERLGVARILAAKQRGSETRYLKLMQRHPRLRAALLHLGSARRRPRTAQRPPPP